MDAYGRSVRSKLSDYHTEEEHDVRPAPTRQDIRIVTQNVRGFRKRDRWEWLSAWRNIPRSLRPALILLQETHVQTEAERSKLTQRWQWMWGAQGKDLRYLTGMLPPTDMEELGFLFFLSTKTWLDCGIVTFGLHGRLGVMLRHMHVLNIYAPSGSKPKSEQFYSDLETWKLSQVDYPILGGGFNCVEDPVLDRLGGSRPEKTECEALTRLVQKTNLGDGRILLGSALDELDLAPEEHFTTGSKTSPAGSTDSTCPATEVNGFSGWK
ncbi:hypothetical protein V7S43_011070 [Phytophthora oleae]|uniref:Endonuclease/exonuclease/phosphatase domain-containing protein n=1 Tax=Phytophthora oleae TaxID=2107226 RepID=A0ABD3FDU0_9STRA